MGALALGLFASSATGQYYVPLRYDLRYSLNPGYITAIPYAQAPARRTEAKVGRNDPCPCGSGKKYKKCCGKQT
jgi:hypothetical protein